MANNPYFFIQGVATNTPTSADNEATSLQKINGLLAIIALAGGGIQGHFDASGNIQIFDSVNNEWRSLTAPNGVLSLGA